MFDPKTREQKFIRLDFPDLETRLITWFTPFFIKHADLFNLEDRSADMDGVTMPMPYGIDISPIDGSVWFSQLNMSHIGRIDPDTFEVTSIPTPFVTPRRLRFDSKGNLWVPSYAEGTINRFDTSTMAWKESLVIPVEPLGSEVPYAVFIDPKTDHVWITGTQSDTLIRYRTRERRLDDLSAAHTGDLHPRTGYGRRRVTCGPPIPAVRPGMWRAGYPR